MSHFRFNDLMIPVLPDEPGDQRLKQLGALEDFCQCNTRLLCLGDSCQPDDHCGFLTPNVCLPNSCEMDTCGNNLVTCLMNTCADLSVPVGGGCVGATCEFDTCGGGNLVTVQPEPISPVLPLPPLLEALRAQMQAAANRSINEVAQRLGDRLPNTVEEIELARRKLQEADAALAERLTQLQGQAP